MTPRAFTVVLAGVSLAAASLAASPVRASPITNHVRNGTFENGFTGWTVTTGPGAVNPGHGPQVVVTNGATPDQFGDVEIADNAVSPSPDPRGTHAVYLVDDVATETLSQQIYLPSAGSYEVGFDALATGSGINNEYNSVLVSMLGGITVYSGSATSFGVNSWTHESANARVAAAGTYTVSFQFTGGEAPAKDIMLSRIYVDSQTSLSDPGLSIGVPEPAGLAVLASGILGFAWIRRRKARRGA